jgi:hypothetical protein
MISEDDSKAVDHDHDQNPAVLFLDRPRDPVGQTGVGIADGLGQSQGDAAHHDGHPSMTMMRAPWEAAVTTRNDHHRKMAVVVDTPRSCGGERGVHLVVDVRTVVG